jgi:hypothetical protein
MKKRDPSPERKTSSRGTQQELKRRHPKVHGWVAQLRASGLAVEVRRSGGISLACFSFRVDGRSVISILRLWATFHSQPSTQ